MFNKAMFHKVLLTSSGNVNDYVVFELTDLLEKITLRQIKVIVIKQ